MPSLYTFLMLLFFYWPCPIYSLLLPFKHIPYLNFTYTLPSAILGHNAFLISCHLIPKQPKVQPFPASTNQTKKWTCRIFLKKRKTLDNKAHKIHSTPEASLNSPKHKTHQTVGMISPARSFSKKLRTQVMSSALETDEMLIALAPGVVVQLLVLAEKRLLVPCFTITERGDRSLLNVSV